MAHMITDMSNPTARTSLQQRPEAQARDGAVYQRAFVILGGLVVLTCLGLSGVARAQSMRLSAGHFAQDTHRGEAPRIAHFSTDNGESFVLDTTQTTPVVRVDGTDEVLALSVSNGSNGDVVFKNDVGETVLKSSRAGLTVFTRDHPSGDAVSLEGAARPLDPGRLSPEALFQVLARASVKASYAVGRLVGFSAEEDTPRAQADYLFADAANNTSAALVNLSRQHNGQAVVSKVREVLLTEGRPPSVNLKEGVLELKLDVSRGWGGRPSSHRVMDVIRKSSGKGR